MHSYIIDETADATVVCHHSAQWTAAAAIAAYEKALCHTQVKFWHIRYRCERERVVYIRRTFSERPRHACNVRTLYKILTRIALHISPMRAMFNFENVLKTCISYCIQIWWMCSSKTCVSAFWVLPFCVDNMRQAAGLRTCCVSMHDDTQRHTYAIHNTICALLISFISTRMDPL